MISYFNDQWKGGNEGSFNFLFVVLGAADKSLFPGIAHMYLADGVKHAHELAAEWILRFAR